MSSEREESGLLVTTLSGPPGVEENTLTVSAVAYALFFVGNDANACRLSLDSDALLTAIPSLSDLWDSNAALIYLSWYVFCVLAWVILPGNWAPLSATAARKNTKPWYDTQRPTNLS